MYAYFEDYSRNVELANYVKNWLGVGQFSAFITSFVEEVIYTMPEILFCAKQKAALGGSLSGEIDTKKSFLTLVGENPMPYERENWNTLKTILSLGYKSYTRQLAIFLLAFQRSHD